MSCGVAGIVKAKKQEQKKKQSSWKNGLLSSKNNERISSFYIRAFMSFRRRLPISFTTGNPIVFEEDYAADKMKRKEYKAAQIAREHNDFNHTVWDAYENEKRFHG